LKTILIVDDEENNRRILKDLIEFYVSKSEEMPQIVEAEDGMEAWNLISKKEIKPLIIFTDYQMPNMNGLELVDKIICESDIVSKIVICSTRIEAKIEAEKKGLKFLFKPFKNNDVFEILKISL